MRFDERAGALTDPETGTTWAPPILAARVREREAQYARIGFAPGDRVFLLHGNTLDFFVDLFAVWELGGCAVPIDRRLTSFEIEVLAGAARPRFLVEGSGPPLPREARGVHPPSDDALILFTSGTTGQPKGVVHTHRSLRNRWEGLRQHLELRAFRRTLCVLPTHFGHGLICNCLFPLLSGCHLFIGPAFRPEIALRLGALLDANDISFMSSVPSLWRLALKTSRPPATRSLELVFCGSAPLTARLWESVREWTGTPRVFNAYGITETGSWLAGTTTADAEPRDGLVGEAWGGTIRVLSHRTTDIDPELAAPCPVEQPGYVWVKTGALMRGYLDREDLTRDVVRDGWFMTGDIGYLDARGRLFLRGREREEINKGGMKIYPSDIDAMVEQFPGVADVCTFAFEDPLHGEDIGIAIVLPGADHDTLGSLRRFLGERLAAHQLPRRWYLVDEIPRTSRGKVNRSSVAGHCAGLTPVSLPVPTR